MSLKSVLLLEDDQEALETLQHLLQPRIPAQFVCTRFPTQAIQLAREYCFDLVLLDVTINYNGNQFGGLDVYRTLHDRYGTSSLLAYSQYINDELLQRYGLPFNFLEKDVRLTQWLPVLVAALEKLRSRQSCFVAMPFGDGYTPLFEVIRECVEEAHFRCVRIDQEVFTKSIVEKIKDEIRKAKLVIFVATDRNPNVFYEAGFSDALGKEVVAITDRHEDLPFDIRDRNTLAYGTDVQSLRTALAEKLASISLIDR
jgi:CheY-like chemotaxis protein